MKQDKIDSWIFTSLIKTIVDALIALLRLLRPQEKKPKPDSPIPIPLPDKPLFPWLRKKIDTIIKDKE